MKKYINLTNNQQPEERRNKMKINLEAVKTVTGLVVSLGVGTVVGNILHTTTPRDAGKIGKALAWVGGVAVESLMAAAATEECDRRIDDIANGVRESLKEKEEKS